MLTGVFVKEKLCRWQCSTVWFKEVHLVLFEKKKIRVAMYDNGKYIAMNLAH